MFQQENNNVLWCWFVDLWSLQPLATKVKVFSIWMVMSFNFYKMLGLLIRWSPYKKVVLIISCISNTFHKWFTKSKSKNVTKWKQRSDTSALTDGNLAIFPHPMIRLWSPLFKTKTPLIHSITHNTQGQMLINEAKFLIKWTIRIPQWKMICVTRLVHK